MAHRGKMHPLKTTSKHRGRSSSKRTATASPRPSSAGRKTKKPLPWWMKNLKIKSQ